MLTLLHQHPAGILFVWDRATQGSHFGSGQRQLGLWSVSARNPQEADGHFGCCQLWLPRVAHQRGPDLRWHLPRGQCQRLCDAMIDMVHVRPLLARTSHLARSKVGVHIMHSSKIYFSQSIVFCVFLKIFYMVIKSGCLYIYYVRR